MALGAGHGVHRYPGKFYQSLTKRLLAFAKAEFELEVLQDGVSVRDHLTQAEKSGRKKDPKYSIPELHPPPPPRVLNYLWGWFCELEQTRDSSGFGLSGIKYREILAWSLLTGRSPTPWEISVIKRLDMARLKIISENSK